MTKTITLLNGQTITLDGTLQTLLKNLHETVSLDHKMVYTTQQLADEIKHLVTRLDKIEWAQYLIQSLIVNFKFYEKELIKEVYDKNKHKHSTN